MCPIVDQIVDGRVVRRRIFGVVKTLVSWPDGWFERVWRRRSRHCQQRLDKVFLYRCGARKQSFSEAAGHENKRTQPQQAGTENTGQNKAFHVEMILKPKMQPLYMFTA